MCVDMTEVRIVPADPRHGHLTWWWPTTYLGQVTERLNGVAVRDSAGALYTGFEVRGLVFDVDGVRFEVLARQVADPVSHPDAATKPR